MKFAPKKMEDDEFDDGPSDLEQSGLVADELTTKSIGLEDDVEDLDAAVSIATNKDLPLEDVEEL